VQPGTWVTFQTGHMGDTFSKLRFWCLWFRGMAGFGAQRASP
jgi:hypothetical protein